MLQNEVVIFVEWISKHFEILEVWIIVKQIYPLTNETFWSL